MVHVMNIEIVGFVLGDSEILNSRFSNVSTVSEAKRKKQNK